MSWIWKILTFLVISSLTFILSLGLCSVSSQLDLEIQPWFTYPLDLYGEEDRINKENLQRDMIINCSSHKCPRRTRICPINSQILAIGRQKMTWNVSRTICKLKEKRHRAINIIILGGSVTAGHHASGCICHDSYCSSIKYESHLPECSWSFYIEKWIKSHFSSYNIHLFNLAQGGLTSGVMSQLLSLKLFSFNISLSRHDIILIDHSVNDALSSGNDDPDILRSGLENLINSLYILSTGGRGYEINNSLPLSLSLPPNIILLEFYPFRNSHQNIPLSPSLSWSDLNQGGYDYGDIYSEIAAKYHLSLWSLRDVIWKSKIQNQNLLDHLRGRHGLHPPWHIHLFYADFIADMLLQTLDSCDHSRQNFIEKKDSLLLPYRRYDRQSGIRICPPSLPPLISLSAHTFSLKSISFSMNLSLFSFREDEDGNEDVRSNLSTSINRKRIGWISQFTKQNSLTNYSDLDSLSHRLIVTSTQKTNHQRYTLDTVSLSAPPFPLRTAPHLLQIQYLKTYQNAGQVTVSLCGQPLTRIDTLWEHFETIHQSIPYIYQFVYDPSFHSFCHVNTEIQIVIHHIPVLKIEEEERRHQIRTISQKVRIDSILFCQLIPPEE